MPGTYRKRIYMSLVHTDSFRQTPICAPTALKGLGVQQIRQMLRCTTAKEVGKRGERNKLATQPNPNLDTYMRPQHSKGQFSVSFLRIVAIIIVLV